jgi:hypothetical protein
MVKRKAESQIVNYQFDFRPLKIENCLDFLACRWHATYHWKVLDKCYNFASYFISTEGLHTKFWASKVIKVPIFGILGPPFGSPGTKWHLGVNLVVMHKVYYKGEGGGFPWVWAAMNFMSSRLLVVRSCTKIAPTLH